MEKCLAKLGCDLCSCAFDEGGLVDIDAYLGLKSSIETYYWILHYSTLGEEPGRRLCLVGKCHKCGKLFCSSTDIPEEKAGDSFLAAVYRWFYQGVCIYKPEFRLQPLFDQEFIKLFKENDRQVAGQWLTLPENQTLLQMYRT